MIFVNWTLNLEPEMPKSNPKGKVLTTSEKPGHKAVNLPLGFLDTANQQRISYR